MGGILFMKASARGVGVEGMDDAIRCCISKNKTYFGCTWSADERRFNEKWLHVFFVRKLFRGLGWKILKFFDHFGAKTFLRFS